MFHTLGFRISPPVGAALGIGLIVLGIASGIVFTVICGAVVVAAASVRFLAWR